MSSVDPSSERNNHVGPMLETLDFSMHVGSTRTFIIIRFKTATTRRVIVS